MHELAMPLLIGLVIMALAFDFLNGLHDAANSIATVVSTRLLSPVAAVVFAAVGNFAAYWLVGLHVAETIGKGIIDPNTVTPGVVFGALVGAMFWNIVTWIKGIPSSSSHALIGGLLGAGIAHGGTEAVGGPKTIETFLAIFMSPLLGMAIAMALVLVTSWIFRAFQPRKAESVFKVMHLFSSAAYSVSHGGNDAQKTMGIISVLLYSTGHLSGGFHVPGWVVLSCYGAIALGTLSGGWKIIKTMGTGIIRITPLQGFAAETAGTATILSASAMGVPVSTTHCINACIMGVGASKRVSAVRWGVAGNILMAWVLTLPLAGALAFATMWIFDHTGVK